MGIKKCSVQASEKIISKSFEKTLDKSIRVWYNIKAVTESASKVFLETSTMILEN